MVIHFVLLKKKKIQAKKAWVAEEAPSSWKMAASRDAGACGHGTEEEARKAVQEPRTGLPANEREAQPL